MNIERTTSSPSLLAAVVAGCASLPGATGAAQLRRARPHGRRAWSRPRSATRASPRSTGWSQDETNRECSAADAAGKPLDPAARQGHRGGQPEDRQVAQRRQVPGRLESRREARAERPRHDLDRQAPKRQANGGNCYNCHQITKEEISFGTIGPSLYNYGKMRGVTDPDSPAAKPIVEYTWGKIWNAKAYNACSNMPRAGHAGILNEQQVRHIVALLLDPQSPVNK